jgi:hypothetical protein
MVPRRALESGTLLQEIHGKPPELKVYRDLRTWYGAILLCLAITIEPEDLATGSGEVAGNA